MNKKILLLIAFIGMLIYGQDVNAQFKLGITTTAGTDLSIDDNGEETIAFGVGVKGVYDITSSFSIAPGFTYFFPSVPDDLDINMYVVDLDAHYNLVANDNFKLYALGGLNYSIVDVSVDAGDFGSVSSSESEIGANFGAGIRSGGDLQFFGDIKYNTAFENINATVGILFNI
jgi:opacity protein-like surface antigen